MATMVNFCRDILGLSISYPHVDDYSDQTWVSFGTGAATFALYAGKETSEVPIDAPKYNFEVPHINESRENLIAWGVEMSEITKVTLIKQICSGRDPENNGFFLEMITE